MALAYHFTTGTGAPTAQLVANGAASVFHGLAAASAEAAIVYLKLYWEGTGTAPPTVAGGAQAATVIPVVGTAKPALTIPIPIAGLFNTALLPTNNGGRLWYWVTANAADTDTTALTAGGDVISIFYA